MTSAADFTRQQPKAIANGNRLDLKMPKIDASEIAFFAMVSATVAMLLWLAAGVVASSDCDARGLVAGAKTRSDVQMSFTFRCVADVDGKWIEVK